jgi:hypothetical protein
MNYRELAKKIIAMWLVDEGTVPDLLDDATPEEMAEWGLLVQEVIEEQGVPPDD